jgi:hypothetical protein
MSMASSEGIAEILKQEHEAHNRGKCRGKDFCDFCIVEAEARASAVIEWLESEKKRLNIEFREHEKDERKRRDLVSRYYYVQDQAAKLREKEK